MRSASRRCTEEIAGAVKDDISIGTSPVRWSAGEVMKHGFRIGRGILHLEHRSQDRRAARVGCPVQVGVCAIGVAAQRIVGIGPIAGPSAEAMENGFGKSPGALALEHEHRTAVIVDAADLTSSAVAAVHSGPEQIVGFVGDNASEWVCSVLSSEEAVQNLFFPETDAAATPIARWGA